RGRRRAVIGLVHARGADCQRARRNVRRSAGRSRSQLIIAGVGAAQAQAGGGNCLGRANGFAGEAGGAAAEGDVFARQHAGQRTGSDRGGGGAIIDFAIGGDTASNGSLIDGKSAAHRVAQAAAAGG